METEQTKVEVTQPPCQHYQRKQTCQTKRGYKMISKCLNCGKVLSKDMFPATTFEGFVRRWVAGKMTEKVRGKAATQSVCGNYRSTATELSYYGSGRNTQTGTDILAIKLPDGRLIGNASKLPRCGSYRRGAESPAQRVMQGLEIPLIPFNVFEEAHLDLQTARVVEQGKTEELLVPKMVWNSSSGQLQFMSIWTDKDGVEKPKKTKSIREIERYKASWSKSKWCWKQIDRRNLERRHFIGAMVLEVAKRYYLFDVDRRELTFYRFNAFLSELPRPVDTIAEAYDSLIPDIVRKAVANGKKVLRQGEWFFIPAKLPKPIKASESDRMVGEDEPDPKKFDLPYWRRRDQGSFQKDIDEHLAKIDKRYHESHLQRITDYKAATELYLKARERLAKENPKKYARRGELRANNNRPNEVNIYLSIPEGQFVSGEVTHSGREHEPLHLKGWYIAVPNTAIGSWQITGAID